MADDPFHLKRFVDAQAGAYDQALAEMRAGAKRSHWIWFVFPQMAGLGRSAMAEHYAIRSLAEARDYLAHPLLGARYRESLAVLRGHTDRDAETMFGALDAMKLRSSLTLFASAGCTPDCEDLLSQWFGGEPDRATLALLGPSPS